MRFESLPRFLRGLLVAGAGLRNSLVRYGAEYRGFSELLASSDGWSKARQEAFQRQELLQLLRAVQPGTPALQSIAGILPHLSTFDDPYEILRVLPFQEKDAMRKRPTDFINVNTKAVMVSSTSGSTGSPMKFGHDRYGLQKRIAFMKDHYRMVGVRRRAKSIRLSGRIISDPDKFAPRPWLYNPAENQVFLSTYHLNDDHAPALRALVRSFVPDIIDGYPSAILDLLKIINRSDEKPSGLKGIITTAETLDTQRRAEIEKLSGSTVCDYYAASEGVHPIQQCIFGTYHVRWQGGIFEVLSSNGTAPTGDGELVCTSFLQRRTPLIRYRTGDLVEGFSVEGNNCMCGMRGPTVTAIVGRVEDTVATPDGRRIGMFPYRTLKMIEGIETSQVIQHSFTSFEVLAVVQNGVDPESLSFKIKSSFERVLGYAITLSLKPVPGIEKGSNGKVRALISMINSR